MFSVLFALQSGAGAVEMPFPAWSATTRRLTSGAWWRPWANGGVELELVSWMTYFTQWEVTTAHLISTLWKGCYLSPGGFLWSVLLTAFPLYIISYIICLILFFIYCQIWSKDKPVEQWCGPYQHMSHQCGRRRAGWLSVCCGRTGWRVLPKHCWKVNDRTQIILFRLILFLDLINPINSSLFFWTHWNGVEQVFFKRPFSFCSWFTTI